MPRELSPFELDRELSRVAPRAIAAYRALRSGREVTLTVPDALTDPETIERIAGDRTDPIAPALMRWLYWLQLMQRGLALEGARVRCYRAQRHALDTPLSGSFTWRELLGHALRDQARRPALLELLFARGAELRDAATRLHELRAELPSFGAGAAQRSRVELELPCPDIAACARSFLERSADAYQNLEAGSLSEVLELGLAHAADDGWPRQLSLRSLHDLLGERDWLSDLRPELGELPAPMSAASFARGMLRLGAAWSEALASTARPFALARDPFGLARCTHGALFAGLVTSAVFLNRQLGVGKTKAAGHARALSASALLFARQMALRVMLDEPALRGPDSLREAFSEHATRTLGFELPEVAAGLFFRPRVGDAQRLAGILLAATRAQRLAEEHDDDWFRNPRAIEQLRAEAREPVTTTCTSEQLASGATTLLRSLTEQL
ncbi:MAG TPA: hypothetical protein VJN18_26625 [Polyangiaceae bacterium]|nr:hypothetical protein [Polyangiaceae bacterium]